MNAKEELLEETRELEILKIDCYFGDPVTPCNEEDRIDTLDGLDVEYDNGYGLQELFGEVYCIDKKTREPVWLTRGEYDGSEWWNVNRIPEFYLNKMSFDEKQALTFYEHLLDLVEKERMSKSFSE